MDVVTAPRRYDVYLVNLDPTTGAEMRKTRPCVVVSPDVMNDALRTVIVAPMTSRVRRYPNRVRHFFQGIDGEIALDQIRTVDRSRLVRRLGALDRATSDAVSDRLVKMFAP
jgi:mRNA interferase MazF